MKKAFQFSPSNVDRCEEAFMREHDAAMGKCSPPFARNVRAKTNWEELYHQFPAPIDLQLKRDRLREADRPRFDCFMEPSYTCLCFKCQHVLKSHIDYYESVKTNIQADWSPPAGTEYQEMMVRQVAVEPVVTEEYYPCVKATSVKHFHKQPPSWDPMVLETPWFSEVKFGARVQEEVLTPRKRWVKMRRVEVTPTQLIFKRK